MNGFDPGDELCAGVVALDHTADVGFDVRAESLPGLFHRAAAGMLVLMEGSDEDRWLEPAPEAPDRAHAAGPPLEARDVALEAGDVASLLALWLRELLYLYEVHGFAYRDAEFRRLDEQGLRARVVGAAPVAAPIRELKGVTYHELMVAGGHGDWRARVIFDV